MRTKKAFKNTLTSLIYQIVTIVCGLITPRLILQNFGSTYNGVVNSATQFLSMISILTLGITGATRVALYKTLGNQDILGTSRIMKATKLYMRKVAACLVLYAAVLCLIYPFISNNSLSHAESALLIAIISISTFAQYFFSISNRTLLQADQSSYILYIMDIAKVIANTILVAVIIRLGGSIFTVKLGSSLVYFITPAITNYYVSKKYHLISDCPPDNTGIEQRSAVAFLSIANLIHNNVDLFLLTVFTDAKVISVYTVYYLAIGKIKNLMQIVTTGMEAAFGNMWAKKEYTALQKNFSGFEFIMYAFTAVIFPCVGMLILPFVARYTKGVNDINYLQVSLAVLITLAESFHCIRQPYMTLVQATGFYRETRNGSAVEAVLNLVVSCALIPFLGINGVILGTLVANTFRTMQYAIFVSKNVLHRSMRIVYGRLGWTAGCAVLTCSLSWLLTGSMTFAPDWSGWILQGTLVFLSSCLVFLGMTLGFYRRDLSLILNVFMRMLKR